MEDSNRFVQKIDTLDMIISVLKEHEQTLDSLIDRIENALDKRGM